jgi:hypothetical protein
MLVRWFLHNFRVSPPFYLFFEGCFCYWLVVSTPLKNMKVSWDDDIPNIWKVIKFHGSSHHQPVFMWVKQCHLHQSSAFCRWYMFTHISTYLNSPILRRSFQLAPRCYWWISVCQHWTNPRALGLARSLPAGHARFQQNQWTKRI